MSDNQDFNDEEYKFVDDPDKFSLEDIDQSPSIAAQKPDAPALDSDKKLWDTERFFAIVKPFIDKLQHNFSLRIGLIVLVVLVLCLLIYRCTTNPLAHQKPQMTAIPVTQPRTIPVQTAVLRTTPETRPVTAPVTVPNQRLSSMEQAQADMQTQVTALSNQLSEANNNLNTMADTMKHLSQQLDTLAIAAQEQAKVTATLNERLRQTTAQKAGVSGKKMAREKPVRYFLQAVIPGRAWLRGSNGDSLTVREGTRIANYGLIRYIDAKTGRVLTSSGQVIKFSQEDS